MPPPVHRSFMSPSSYRWTIKPCGQHAACVQQRDRRRRLAILKTGRHLLHPRSFVPGTPNSCSQARGADPLVCTRPTRLSTPFLRRRWTRPHRGGTVDRPAGDWYFMALVNPYPGGRPRLHPLRGPRKVGRVAACHDHQCKWIASYPGQLPIHEHTPTVTETFTETQLGRNEGGRRPRETRDVAT
ncbi:hypothetical protein C8R43DRAFT_553398 [Mycena crocata]|nr:hypothetical protein C8R43DRAFT_553398 [Mycena crocata]